MAERSTGARIYLSIIGLLLFLAGGSFTWLMGRSFVRAREIESWPRVEAVILESGAAERRVDPSRPIERRFSVLYAYEWEGQEYESDRFSLRGSRWTGKTGKVEALVEKYPVGSLHEAAVDPGNPAMTLLDRESRAAGYSIWFPALIAVGGIGTIVGAWRKGKRSG